MMQTTFEVLDEHQSRSQRQVSVDPDSGVVLTLAQRQDFRSELRRLIHLPAKLVKAQKLPHYRELLARVGAALE